MSKKGQRYGYEDYRKRHELCVRLVYTSVTKKKPNLCRVMMRHKMLQTFYASKPVVLFTKTTSGTGKALLTHNDSAISVHSFICRALKHSCSRTKGCTQVVQK